jgi:hypothetical protein
LAQSGVHGVAPANKNTMLMSYKRISNSAAVKKNHLRMLFGFNNVIGQF